MKASECKIGLKIGDLEIIEEPSLKPIKDKKRKQRMFVLCKCSCGKEVYLTCGHLNSRKSCGCNKSKWVSISKKIHGKSRTKEYYAWKNMITRCYSEKHKYYYLYGGRGIFVCDSWVDKSSGFISFLSDMGSMPTPKHQLDRKDNDKGYSPENCRWATPMEQSRNQRRNVYITHNGERLCARDWSIRTGVSQSAIMERLEMGISMERVFDKTRLPCKARITITHNGITESINGWAKILNIESGTIRTRIKRGLTTEEILNTSYKKRKHGKTYTS